MPEITLNDPTHWTQRFPRLHATWLLRFHWCVLLDRRWVEGVA
jgi:hypothetical protein